MNKIEGCEVKLEQGLRLLYMHTSRDREASGTGMRNNSLLTATAAARVTSCISFLGPNPHRSCNVFGKNQLYVLEKNSKQSWGGTGKQGKLLSSAVIFTQSQKCKH